MDRYSTLGVEELYRRGRRATFPDLLVRPPLTFFMIYLFRGGVFEGWRGLFLSGLYAFHTVANTPSCVSECWGSRAIVGSHA